MTDTPSHDGPLRLDAALRLLDRQLVDRRGRLCGKADDLELERRDDGTLVVTAILTGPGALGPRLPGRLGRFVTAAWRRLHQDEFPAPGRIPLALVTEIGSGITLSATREELPTHTLERWTMVNIVEKHRRPGAGGVGLTMLQRGQVNAGTVFTAGSRPCA